MVRTISPERISIVRSTPGAAAGHQPVEVGAADERELRAEGDRGDDVGAVHDAGVDHHLDVLADLAHDLGQQVERDRRAVELTAAVVGQQDAVDAHVDQPPESSTFCTPLTTILPGQMSRMIGEIVER